MQELQKSMDMAQAIKNVLKERNISKSEFAELMEKDYEVVKEWLSGNHIFNLPTLFEISIKLKLI